MLPHWKPGCQKPHGVGCQNCVPLLQESGVIRLLSWLRSLTTGIRGKSKARSIASSCSSGNRMDEQDSSCYDTVSLLGLPELSTKDAGDSDGKPIRKRSEPACL